jgi:hypothetical protein
MRRNPGTSVRLSLAAAALGAMFMVAGCGGSNLFSVSAVSGGTGGGSQAVTVQILNVPTDSILAVGDSLFVRARLTDAAGLASARMYGFAHRGVDSLGTGQDVPRFTEKDIAFATPVTDTTIVRYLVATSDTTHETVYIVVEAADSAGNTGADTVSVLVGGPSPVASISSSPQVDGTASFRVLARDSHRADRVAVGATRDGRDPVRFVDHPMTPAFAPQQRGTPSRRRSSTW